MSKLVANESLQRRVGQLVGDRYRVHELVGVGGQGAVYRCEDLRTRGEVAIKVLHDEVDADPTARERLTREAQAMKQLAGTAAVQVLDQTFTPDGRFCLITELLRGEGLEAVLARVDAQGMTFPVAEIPFLFRPLVETLERAHAIDIIHRDLKPENVFLQHVDGGMRVRLMDFGFAKFTRMSKLTVEGFVAGSPTYLAPESWLGQPVTVSTDAYAISAMMYRTLAGAPPFNGASAVELFKQVTQGPRPSLHAVRPDIPAVVDRWVAQALHADPKIRFQTPRATYSALCSLLGLS